jgi:hypothetical protein
VTDFDFPADLLDLERTAWAALQAGQLTVQQAAAVHDGIVAYAEQIGAGRHAVEMALKRVVRHGETA